MTYEIAICDDEEKQRVYIKSLVERWLHQTFHHVKIQEYASSEQFLFEQAYDRTQILFLDIEMEKMDGIALAREIRKHNRQMQIIFVTGYMEYIQEGYDVEALHYLLKPVSQEKIDSVLERAVERFSSKVAEKFLGFRSRRSVLSNQTGIIISSMRIMITRCVALCQSWKQNWMKHLSAWGGHIW